MNPERVAVLWGGGLGDALVIRPVLEAASRPGWPTPVYFTRVRSGVDLLVAMGLSVRKVYLPESSLAALRLVRRAGHFDRVYVGPHNRWRSRLLARAFHTDRYGPRHPRLDERFLGDVIAEDVVTMGWVDALPPCYGSRPLFPAPVVVDQDPPREPPPAESYLIAHPGSRSGWETTRWPMDRWALLLRELMRSGWCIRLVGSPDEHESLRALVASLSPSSRLTIHTDWPLWQLERMVAGAEGVVCHNSGIMHLALAYQRRTVVLTGSSAAYWQANDPWVRNLTSGECHLACNRYRCPVPGFHARCIRHLEVAQALAVCHEHWLRP